MICYLSGIKTAWYAIDVLSKEPDVLVSFLENWIPNKRKVARVFLDSGAFTAFNKRKEINLGQYIDFCHKNSSVFETMAALDVIGDWEKSKSNYIDMRKSGLDVLPTYHVGEPLSFLDWLFERYDYVGIGGLVPYISMTAKSTYYDALIRLLTFAHKKAAEANIKLHGFGVTGWNLMSMFPWYSVDSTTYLAGQKFARVIYMKGGRLVGNYDYQQAAIYSKKIGLNFSPADIIPGKKGNSTKERYLNIIRLNIEAMFEATDLINKRRGI